MLTISIPSYNYGHYLSEAIDSCLADPAEFKLIVLDNASTDDTPSLRERYTHDHRVKWVRNENVLSVQDNWNKAVYLTDTKWVKILQADDRLMPGAVSGFLRMLQVKPDAWFHGHLCEIINGSGDVVRKQMPYSHSGAPVSLETGEGLFLKLLQVARLKEPTSNLFRREAWEAVGGYPKNSRFTFDLLFNVELMARYPGVLWSDYFAQVRRHKNSDGFRLPAQLAMDDLSLLITRILRDVPTNQAQLAGRAWQQYRAIELALQRMRHAPGTTGWFLLKQLPLFMCARSWPQAGALALRRFRSGDVQLAIEDVLP